MKLSEHNNIAETAPLNSNASFRAELEKIQTQSEVQEGADDPRENAEIAKDDESGEEGSESSEQDSDGMSERDNSDDDDSTSGDNGTLYRYGIPRKRLNKEVERRQKAEQEAQKVREEYIRVQTELDMINKALQHVNHKEQAPQAQEAEAFEPLDDAAHRFYASELTALKKQIAEQQQMIQGSNFATTLNAHQEAFSREKPDFKDAYKHLMQVEIEAAQHFTQNHEQAVAAAQQKLYHIAQGTMNKGHNVASIFYNMANQYGYKGAQKASSKPAADIDAINKNMKKSSVADIDRVALPIGNGAGNYTTLENFSKWWDSTPSSQKVDEFHAKLKAIQKGT